MIPHRFAVAAVLLVACGGASSATPPRSPEEPADATAPPNVAAPDAPVESAASAAPTAAPPPSAPPAPARTPRKSDVVPHSGACKKDADCDSVIVEIDSTSLSACCVTCDPIAGSVAWVSKVTKACAQRGRPKIPCAPVSCAAPPTPICVAGACTLPR